jgi:hypothetical protein
LRGAAIAFALAVTGRSGRASMAAASSTPASSSASQAAPAPPPAAAVAENGWSQWIRKPALVLYPRERLERSPSRASGVTAAKESDLRVFFCSFIHHAGQLLEMCAHAASGSILRQGVGRVRRSRAAAPRAPAGLSCASPLRRPFSIAFTRCRALLTTTPR